MLNPETVMNLFVACLDDDDGQTTDQVIVEGIVMKAVFDRERLDSHRQQITDLLTELPAEFHANTGGGWTFLNMCNDRHGHLWTGLHAVMERLVLLGIATNQVSFLMPREAWPSLPGGMPYRVVQ
jgi:hypothetical protein